MLDSHNLVLPFDRGWDDRCSYDSRNQHVKTPHNSMQTTYDHFTIVIGSLRDVNIEMLSPSQYNCNCLCWLAIIRHITYDENLAISRLDFCILYTSLHHRGPLSVHIFSYTFSLADHRITTFEVHSYACGSPRHYRAIGPLEKMEVIPRLGMRLFKSPR